MVWEDKIPAVDFLPVELNAFGYFLIRFINLIFLDSFAQ